MKQKYRIIDIIIQVLLIAVWLYFVFKWDKYVLYMYFIVGGWYIISLIIHAIISNSKHKTSYTLLLKLSLALLIIALVGFILLQFILVLELFMLLFISPVMALLYTYTCFSEIKDIGRRPISLLK